MLPAYCKEAKFPSLSTDLFIEVRLKIKSISQKKTNPALSLSTDNAMTMILRWTTIKGFAQTFKFHNQHDIIVHRQSGQQIATLTYTNAFNLAL